MTSSLPDLPALPGIPDVPDLPDLDRLTADPSELDTVTDPLGSVDYSGDLRQDIGAELTALEQGYRDRAKAEQKRFTAATDSEYWVAVCFTSREEKEAFLKAAKVPPRMGDKYLDGRQLAKRLGYSL